MESTKSLPWHEVEAAINKEINWLQSVILESNYHGKKDYCSICIFRRLAILIISGKIRAKDIRSSVSLWGQNNFPIDKKTHGGDWHHQLMNIIHNYFESLNYEVYVEPYLNLGRADLGVYKYRERNLFIEIGTISLPKLLHNLESMDGSDFLLVLDVNHAVEFSILKASYQDSIKTIN